MNRDDVQCAQIRQIREKFLNRSHFVSKSLKITPTTGAGRAFTTFSECRTGVPGKRAVWTGWELSPLYVPLSQMRAKTPRGEFIPSLGSLGDGSRIVQINL